MSKSPPVFRQIAPLDVPDEALDALGDHLGVPKMLKPQSVPSSKVVSDPEKRSQERPAPAPEADSAFRSS